MFPAVLKRTRPLDRRQREGATMFHGGHYGPAAPCDCGLFNARGARPQLGLAFRCEVGCHESARYGCGKLHPTKVGPCLIALALCSAYLIALTVCRTRLTDVAMQRVHVRPIPASVGPVTAGGIA